MKTVILAALALGVAAPAFAQDLNPGYGHGPHGIASTLSPQGQAILRQAHQAANPREDRGAIKAIRDRILSILDADTLDQGALSRAMEDERNAVAQQQQRRQYAMLQAFGQLSPADRKAFVADARAERDKLAARMQAMQARGFASAPGQ